MDDRCFSSHKTIGNSATSRVRSHLEETLVKVILKRREWHHIMTCFSLSFSCLARRCEKAVEAILATEIGRKCAAIKDTQGRVPAHLAAMSSRRDLVELLLPHSGLGSDVGLDAVMARGKVNTLKRDGLHLLLSLIHDLHAPTPME